MPGPAARRWPRGWGVAAVVGLGAAVVLVVGMQIWEGDRGAETSSNGAPHSPSVQTDPGQDAARLLASFEGGTEGWGPDERVSFDFSTEQASDYSTDGSFSLQVDTAGPVWVQHKFARPIDISGKSALSLDIETVRGVPQTAIAVKLGDDDIWCQSEDLDAKRPVRADFGKMECYRENGPPNLPPASDLTELRAILVYFDVGSFRVDNVRLE